MPTLRLFGAAALLPVVLVVSACAPTASGSDDGVLSVVASTDVYGSIAEAIGGDAVEVTSIIEDAAQDPHSYEGTARVQLALSKADVVIENGGGYDDFVDTMLGAVDEGADARRLITVVDLSPADTETNEHVWYDLPTVAALGDELVATLSEVDPENAAEFEAGNAEFQAAVTGLEQSVADLSASHAGEGYALTEPVPAYLLDAAGLVDLAPAEFGEAIEEGTDVAPDVLAAMLETVSGGSVRLLAYNDQTAGAETEEVREAAERDDVPVVSFTETLPDGETYLTWMTANIAAVGDALGSA